MASASHTDNANKTPRQRSRQASRNSTKLNLAVIDENEQLSPDDKHAPVTESELLRNTKKRNRRKKGNKNDNTKKDKDNQGESPVSTDIREYESKDPREILEEKRQEVIHTYYEEVKERAKLLVKIRMQRKEEERKARESAEEKEREEEELREMAGLDRRQSLPTIAETPEEHSAKNIVPPIPDKEQPAVASTSVENNRAESPLNINQNSLSEDFDLRDSLKSEEVFEMEKEAEKGILVDSGESDVGSDEESEESDVDEDGNTFFADVFKQAMHEAIWEDDQELLDDLLDLPGGGINTTWFGENMLMTAIRANKDHISTYLIDNGIDVNFQVIRFEKRSDVEDEMEIKIAAAKEHEAEEQRKAKKKKKSKDKEKSIEEIEKDILLQLQAKSPETKVSTKLTDVDCFYIDCRGLAQEFHKEDLVDLIDEARGDQWPSKIKKREKLKRKDLRDKMEKREDWIFSEEEEEELEEEIDEIPPEPVKPIQPSKIMPHKKKAASLFSRGQSQSDSKNTSKETDLQNTSKLTTASKEKLGDSFTVAGESEVEPPTPPPSEAPLVLIHQATIPMPTKTSIPYRTTRSFLSRKEANSGCLTTKSTSMNSIRGRSYVQAWGSFMAESKHWDPNIKCSHNAVKKETKELLRIKREVRKPGDFQCKNIYGIEKDLQYYKVKAAARQFSPWEENNPILLSKNLKRSKTEIVIHREKKPKERSIHSNIRPHANNTLKSQSSLAFDTKPAGMANSQSYLRPRPKTQGDKPNTFSPVINYDLTRNSKSSRSVRCASHILDSGHILPQKHIRDSYFPNKGRYNIDVIQLYQSLQSSIDKKCHNLRESRGDAWRGAPRSHNSSPGSKLYTPLIF